MIEFNNEELYEIEKRFDIHAGQTAHGVAELVNKLSIMGKNNILSKKVFDEVVNDYHVYRTISAKAKAKREVLESKE